MTLTVHLKQLVEQGSRDRYEPEHGPVAVQHCITTTFHIIVFKTLLRTASGSIHSLTLVSSVAKKPAVTKHFASACIEASITLQRGVVKFDICNKGPYVMSGYVGFCYAWTRRRLWGWLCDFLDLLGDTPAY